MAGKQCCAERYTNFRPNLFLSPRFVRNPSVRTGESGRGPQFARILRKYGFSDGEVLLSARESEADLH